MDFNEVADPEILKPNSFVEEMNLVSKGYVHLGGSDYALPEKAASSHKDEWLFAFWL